MLGWWWALVLQPVFFERFEKLVKVLKLRPELQVQLCLAWLCAEIGSSWLAYWPSSTLLPSHPQHLRSFSTSRLTDLLLKAAFGTQASDSGSTDSLQEKPMEIGM